MGALYTSPDSGLVNGVLTQSCGLPTTIAGFACGDYAVNTHAAGLPAVPPALRRRRLPAQTNPTIGDRLSGDGRRLGLVLGRLVERERRRRRPRLDERHRSGAHADRLLRPERRPDASQPGRTARTTCSSTTTSRSTTTRPSRRDAGRAREPRRAPARRAGVHPGARDGSTSHCNLKPVSFIKPIGEENEHPGYASEPDGSDHLVDLLQSIENSTCAKNTMVVVTYDEFGGQWDHVSPPGQGNDNGPHDQWGPGTRIPALVLGPHLKGAVRRRPHRVRHDLDPGDDRAALRTRSAELARRCDEQPRERLRRALGAGLL